MNTLPLENFLHKARIAIKSNQKNLTLTISEVQQISDSLAIVMTRLAGRLDEQAINTPVSSKSSPNFDGGSFT